MLFAIGLIKYLDAVLSLPLEVEFLVYPGGVCAWGVTAEPLCAAVVSDSVEVETASSIICVMS